MLLINGKIFTMAEKIIENGFILIENGKIKQVDEMYNLDFSDPNTIDLKGMQVYPGLIDSHTHLGIFGDALSFEGEDGNEDFDPITPNISTIDAVNPLDRTFKEALAGGVTTVLVSPGSANPIAGQIIATKTYGKRIDDMIIKSPIAIKFAFGENPKNTYNTRNQSPVTRMAIAALIREELNKAQRYLQDKELFKNDEENYDLPEYNAKSEALIPLLKGEIPVHFHAHRADDIFTGIRIAKEFNLKYIIVHGTDSHLVTNELKKEKAKILLGPILGERSKPELINSTAKTPALLNQSDIEFALITDHPEMPIQYLRLCAAIAVKEGLDKNQALKALTINPAKICGLEKNIGSIEPNKEADILVIDGNLLDILAPIKMVIAGGKLNKF